MKILLISPKNRFLDERPGTLRIPQLTLPILVALTPSEHEVVAVEEEFGPVPFDADWDVVGISAMTATAPRAYELASLFNHNGAKVILGGIHPSVLPREAARFADAVVVGEAEGVWKKILYDVEHNQLQKFYYNRQPDLSQSPLPVRRGKRSVFGLNYYVTPVMTSRGCPYDCEFCCVHGVYGRKQRHIPLEHIIEDIGKSGTKRVMFLDDNLGGDRSYAMPLIEALRPLKLNWYAQAPVRFILDDEMFYSAVRSGLKALFVGVESVEPEGRRTIRKLPPSVELVEKAIKRCRSAGVIFHASFVFGRDEDSPRVFDRTLDFLLQNSVPSISPCILTPYPGTPLFERLMREERILHRNWAYYDHNTVCFKPKGMPPEELAARYLEFRNRFFSYSSIMRRGWAQIGCAPFVYLFNNVAHRRNTKRMENRFKNYFSWLHDDNRSGADPGMVEEG